VCADVGSSRQPVTALQAPGLQHGPTGAGGHTSAKAVLGGSMFLVRLIRTLHDGLLWTRIRPRGERTGKWLDNSPLIDSGRARPALDECMEAGYGRTCEMGNSSLEVDLARLIHSLLWSPIPRSGQR
jgi:hypothetical protein